jgi:hypothetical protein
MKRSLVCALAAALCFGAVPAFAQHGGGPHGGPGMGAGGGMGMGPGTGSGMGMGRGMDEGRGRGPTSTSNMGNQAPTSMGKTPDQILTQNTKLSQNLANLLPAGTNLADASKGFKNLGQFVAAVHVSHNLDIPFADLKSKVTSGESLGHAIRDLKPDVNAKGEAKKADKQAKQTLQDTNS